MEGQCFILFCTQVNGKPGFEKNLLQKSKMWGKPGGGGSAVIAPDGTFITENLELSEEGLCMPKLIMILLS